MNKINKLLVLFALVLFAQGTVFGQTYICKIVDANGEHTFTTLNDALGFARGNTISPAMSTTHPVTIEMLTNYTIFNGDFHYAHLIDNLTGADIDLLSANEYKFEASTEDYASRFRLVIDVTGIDEPQTDYDDTSGQGTFAFQFGDELVVTGKGTLQFFDLNGRCLLSTNVVGEQSSVALPKVAKGVYLLRLTGSKQTQVQKIIIK